MANWLQWFGSVVGRIWSDDLVCLPHGCTEKEKEGHVSRGQQRSLPLEDSTVPKQHY